MNMSQITLPKYQDNTLLFVSVVHLSTEEVETLNCDFEENFPGVESQSPLFQNLPQNEKEKETAGDLYSLASYAKKLGWKWLYVIDSMSRRLLSGSDLWAIDEEDSFGVMIETEWKGKHGLLTAKCESTILARRASMSEFVEGAGRPEDLRKHIVDLVGFVDRTLDFRYGFELLDPHKPLHSSAIQQVRRDERLENTKVVMKRVNKLLPVELRTIIADLAEESLRPDRLTSAPAELDWNEEHIHIQLAAPVSDQEHERLQSECTNIVRKVRSQASCTLHKWIGTLPASYLELWRVWERMKEANIASHIWVVLFFIYPEQLSEQQPRLSMIYSEDPFYPALRQPTFVEALTYLRIREFPQKPGNYENAQVFPVVDYPFHPISLWPSYPADGLDNSMLLFHLTSDITSDQVASLNQAMHLSASENQYDSESDLFTCLHIPWNREAPGEVEDAYKILYNCKVRDGSFPDMAVFVPSTFHRDDMVWLAEFEYDSLKNSSSP